MKQRILAMLVIVIISALMASCGILPAGATPTPEPTETPTPTPAPTPMPTPTPSPTPDPGPYGDGAYVTETYDVGYPAELTQNFLFNHSDQIRYLDYIVVMEDGFIYPDMDTSTEPMTEADYTDRYLTSAKLVKGDEATGTWYRIHWTKTVEGEEKELVGYINEDIADYREFQIETAYADVLFLAQKIEEGEYTYVVNRNNEISKESNIDMPYGGKTDEFDKPVDDYGTLQDQSAPIFENEDMTGAWRYAPDGSLVEVQSSSSTMSKVYIPEYDSEYYIPREYLRRNHTSEDIAIEKLKQAYVIDRKNQNAMFFVRSEETGAWEVLSMSYVSTGKASEFAEPTPLGFFAVQKMRVTQPYPSDTTGAISGYMPYAIRFSGGAYVHAVPVNYKTDDSGNRVDPGLRQSHPSLGVQPESHMCVRNYTDHAKFLYNRIKVGDAAIIVVE